MNFLKKLKDKKLDKENPPYITNEGYKQVYRPNHPNARTNGYVPEHIYNATNGKKELDKNYVVHHKDGNKLNNKKSNLEIMTRSEHSKRHKKIM